MPSNWTNDCETLALRALAAAMSEERLAQRFLSLTGLTAPELRQRAGDPRLLAALLSFLEAHEPDLLAIAERIDSTPDQIVAVRRALEP